VTGGGWLVGADLDQTLIYSRRSFRLPPGTAEPDLVVTESLEGVTATFMTSRAAGLLRGLAAVAVVVPVTTRTNAQYVRVDLGLRPAFAITANGGHLLVDGRVDPLWEDAVRTRIASTSRPLPDVMAVAERFGAGWARVTKVADDLFVYLVAHDRTGIPDTAGLTADLAADGWTVSTQGRKVYLVPVELTKQAALAEVARRSGARRVAAAGDAVLDRAMLERADVAIRPSHGELHDLGWRAPHLRVTAAAGILAGEEIVSMLSAVTAPDVSR
jgi:hypothetical protein